MALTAQELAELHARVKYAHYNGFSLAKADEYAAALGGEAPQAGVVKHSTGHLLALITKHVPQAPVQKPVPKPVQAKPVQAKPVVSTVVKPVVQTKPLPKPIPKPVAPPVVQAPVAAPVPAPHAPAEEVAHVEPDVSVDELLGALNLGR